MQEIDYLAIGHVAKDIHADGFTLGGSVLFASAAAARLGCGVAMVTACEPGIDLQGALGKTPVSFAPSLTSTVFENIYRDGKREQYLHQRAADLAVGHVPPAWRSSRLVHLAPIAQELTADIVDAFTGSFIGLTPQGWLRGWDRTGRVTFRPWPEAAQVLPRVNAVVISEEDVNSRGDIIDYYAALAPVLAVTMGQRGAKVHTSGGWRHVQAFPAQEVDPTGAGDIFATAFFYRLQRTGDPAGAAAFANCTASFSVEAQGTAAIPNLDMVERRLRGER